MTVISESSTFSIATDASVSVSGTRLIQCIPGFSDKACKLLAVRTIGNNIFKGVSKLQAKG